MDNFTSPATLPGTGVHEPSVTAGDCVCLVCKCVQTQNLFGGILEMYHVTMYLCMGEAHVYDSIFKPNNLPLRTDGELILLLKRDLQSSI